MYFGFLQAGDMRACGWWVDWVAGWYPSGHVLSLSLLGP